MDPPFLADPSSGSGSSEYKHESLKSGSGSLIYYQIYIMVEIMKGEWGQSKTGVSEISSGMKGEKV